MNKKSFLVAGLLVVIVFIIFSGQTEGATSLSTDPNYPAVCSTRVTCESINRAVDGSITWNNCVWN